MSNKFQILSLDGGGIKGIFSAAVLAKLEDDLQTDITKHFDLIVGTSTGGIIALGLGIGMRPHEILKFYLDNGITVFPSGVYRWLRHWVKFKYDSEPFEVALQKCFGNKLLGESNKRLVIPSYNIGEDDVYLFKTSHHERLKRDYKVPIWQVARATSAAPTYFSSFKGIDGMRLVDGGVWANNPTYVGIAEAVSMLGQPIESVYCFSLGTTLEVKRRHPYLDKGGLFQWRKEASEVILRAQSIGVHTQALHLLGQGKVVRLDPSVPEGLFSLDRASHDELMAKAAHESRKFSPEFKERFMGHVADEFKPVHALDTNGG